MSEDRATNRTPATIEPPSTLPAGYGMARVPMNEMWRMAQAICRSGLFGIKVPEQALALMLIAEAEGKHPALVARDFDIIQGRPAKRSEAMLRDFLAGGGRVEWHRLDAERAEATFSHPAGGSRRLHWDLDMAREAGLAGKDGWKKYPRAMLRSRLISEGVRTIFPGATSGMYDPDEEPDIGGAPPEARRGRREPRGAAPADPAVADATGSPIPPETAPERPQGPAPEPVVYQVVDDIGELHAHDDAASAVGRLIVFVTRCRKRPDAMDLLRDNNAELIEVLRAAGHEHEAAEVEALLGHIPSKEPDPAPAPEAEPERLYWLQPHLEKGKTRSPLKALQALRTALDGIPDSGTLETFLVDDGAVTLAQQFRDAGLEDLALEADGAVADARERFRAKRDEDLDDELPF